jgi:FkbM family methyltransferase
MAKIGFGQVFSFEPIPSTYERLIKNIDLNPHLSSRIHPIEMGIGDSLGQLDFCEFPQSPEQSSIKKDTAPPNNLDFKIHLIKVETLDFFSEVISIKKLDSLRSI